MILLTKGQTAEEIVVTLNEFRTLSEGSYLFVFTHILTRNIVTKIFTVLSDESADTDRYNQFEINTSTVFLNQPVGFWNYDIYEQESEVNEDPEGLTRLENGIMKLLPATVFAFEEYSESTTFKAYNG